MTAGGNTSSIDGFENRGSAWHPRLQPQTQDRLVSRISKRKIAGSSSGNVLSATATRAQGISQRNYANEKNSLYNFRTSYNGTDRNTRAPPVCRDTSSVLIGAALGANTGEHGCTVSYQKVVKN
jgi:hypothetical protein